MAEVSVEIVEAPIRRDAARAAAARPENGALLVFEGLVRDHHEGRAVAGIEYSAYRAMAEETLRDVAEEVAQRHAITALHLVHRLGRLEVGEASLLVVVGAHHRRPAFAAGLELIDRLKERVPIWKKEWGPDGEHWVEGVRPQAPGAGHGA